MQNVLRMQQAIIEEYKVICWNMLHKQTSENQRMRFESIPRQLSKENKKFAIPPQYDPTEEDVTIIGSLQWIEDAGIIRRCYNLSARTPPDG